MGKKIKIKKIPTFITRDALRREVEKKTNGAVTILYDDKGYPSYMLVIPKFNVQDIDPRLGSGVHPAFLCHGKELEKIFIAQFQAAVVKGRAVSMPDFDPQYSINFDEARTACTAKGPGWHLLTAWEWAALSFYITKNHSEYFNREWWEWTDGLKIIDGKLIFPSKNDIYAPEDSWPAQDVCFDDRENETPILSAKINHYTEENPRGENDTRDGDFTAKRELSDIERSESYMALPQETREKMAKILIDIPPRMEGIKGGIWVRNYGERVPIRGGSWRLGASAGLGALYLLYRRSYSSNTVGFRPAFIE